MSMQVIQGAGKLYDADGKQLIADVNYQIWEKPPTGGWRGEFTLDYDIRIHGKYIIELDDGRKGICFIPQTRIQSVSGLPTVYHYNFQGTGTLT